MAELAINLINIYVNGTFSVIHYIAFIKIAHILWVHYIGGQAIKKLAFYEIKIVLALSNLHQF